MYRKSRGGFIVGEKSARLTEGREGGAVDIGSTVGLTGFVGTRYCRCYSVKLVYPCVDARSWSHWSMGPKPYPGVPRRREAYLR
jgi:hypothetical protein